LPVAVTVAGSRRPICEIRHLELVEDRELDRLLGARGQEPARFVELLDLVDRREIRAAELRQLPAEGEAGPDPPDEADLGEGVADVRDRRFRQAEAAGELARAGRLAGAFGEDIEDRAGARDSRRQRFALRGVIARPNGIGHVVHSPRDIVSQSSRPAG
jgi:hypothetical protein